MAAECIVGGLAEGEQDPGILTKVFVPAGTAKFIVACYGAEEIGLFLAGKAKAVCQFLQRIGAEYPFLGILLGCLLYTSPSPRD